MILVKYDACNKENCLRITLHHSYFSLFLSVGNLLSVVEVIHRFTFEAIGNATFSVDSFFFLRYVVDSYLIWGYGVIVVCISFWGGHWQCTRVMKILHKAALCNFLFICNFWIHIIASLRDLWFVVAQSLWRGRFPNVVRGHSSYGWRVFLIIGNLRWCNAEGCFSYFKYLHLVYYIENNTRAHVDMEFLFQCSTR